MMTDDGSNDKFINGESLKVSCNGDHKSLTVPVETPSIFNGLLTDHQNKHVNRTIKANVFRPFCMFKKHFEICESVAHTHTHARCDSENERDKKKI